MKIRVRVTVVLLTLVGIGLLTIGIQSCRPSKLQTSGGPTSPTTATSPATSPSPASPPRPAPASHLAGTIKIGCAGAFTGPFSSVGQSIRNGVALAAQEIADQKPLGDATLQVIYEDTPGPVSQGADTFRKLIQIDDVVAILGPTLSSIAVVADPIAQATKIPVLATSNAAPGIVEIGDYIFRDSCSETEMIPQTIAVAQRVFRFKTAALIYDEDDDTARSSYAVFSDELARAGVKVLATETFKTDDTDFHDQLERIKAQTPEAILVSSPIDEAAKIVVQGREIGIPETVHFIGADAFTSSSFLELAGAAAEGAVTALPWSLLDPRKENQAFVAAYRKAYNRDPDQFAAQAYTGAWLLATAIKNAGSPDSTAIRDALAAIHDFPSPLGAFSFNGDREPAYTPVVVIVRDGKLALLQ